MRPSRWRCVHFRARKLVSSSSSIAIILIRISSGDLSSLVEIVVVDVEEEAEHMAALRAISSPQCNRVSRSYSLSSTAKVSRRSATRRVASHRLVLCCVAAFCSVPVCSLRSTAAQWAASASLLVIQNTATVQSASIVD